MNNLMGEQGGILTNRIAVLRAECKMTQKDLAEKAGVSRQTIISIEKGKYTPSLTLAFEIANVFEVEINDVFQYTKSEKEEL
jgi:putative transcriptional regulator